MATKAARQSYPEIPDQNYFTIGEASALCMVKPHMLRYWEREFTQLQDVMRHNNRRYYSKRNILMIRSIRDLLYDQGYTVSGARDVFRTRGEKKVVQERQFDTAKIRKEISGIIKML